MTDSKFDPGKVHVEWGCVKNSKGDKDGVPEDSKKLTESNFEGDEVWKSEG